MFQRGNGFSMHQYFCDDSSFFLDSASIKWVLQQQIQIPIEAVLFKINTAVTETSYKFSYVHCT